MPQYDYLYFGDTMRVPYGTRSQTAIHQFVSEALDFLFRQDCQIIILACNTASAESLRKSQQEYLPKNYPDRRVLGVIIPAVETLIDYQYAETIGVMATPSTVNSRAYEREINRQLPGKRLVQVKAPLLVPLIEGDGLKYVGPILDDYLNQLGPLDALILGCTHYAILKGLIRSKVCYPVLSQDEYIPEKLADYLIRHPEFESKLSRTGRREYYVSDLTDDYQQLASRLCGASITLRRV